MGFQVTLTGIFHTRLKPGVFFKNHLFLSKICQFSLMVETGQDLRLLRASLGAPEHRLLTFQHVADQTRPSCYQDF